MIRPGVGLEGFHVREKTSLAGFSIDQTDAVGQEAGGKDSQNEKFQPSLVAGTSSRKYETRT